MTEGLIFMMRKNVNRGPSLITAGDMSMPDKQYTPETDTPACYYWKGSKLTAPLNNCCIRQLDCQTKDIHRPQQTHHFVKPSWKQYRWIVIFLRWWANQPMWCVFFRFNLGSEAIICLTEQFNWV